MAKIDWSEFSPVDTQSGQAVDWNSFTPIPAEKDQPGLAARAKQGLESTVGNIKIAATNDPTAIAQTIAEGEKSRLPQTATQIKMAQEMKPLQDEYAKAEGLDAVGVFARMAAKRLAQFVTNPSEAAGAIVENLPNSAPGLAAGAAGAAAGSAVLPGVGTLVGGVAGGTAGGYAVEQGAAMRDQILKEAAEQGIDPRDARALEPLIREKYDQFLEKSRLKGIGTAGTDAVLNAVTFGLAGAGERAIVRGVTETTQAARAGAVTAEQAAARLGELQAQQAARMTLPARAARGAAVTGSEMAGEGLSEAAGQKLAYGQVDALDVIDESLLGLGQGVGMAAGRGLINRAIGQPNANTVDKAFSAAQEELSRRRQVEAEQQLQAAPDASAAAAAASNLAGSVDELTSAVNDYLRGAPAATPGIETPAQAAAAAGVDTSIPALRARADREAELLSQANAAGTEFERNNALAQVQALRPEAQPGPAAGFADLTPMSQSQANQRLAVMRDMAANEGGNALALSVVPHPSQAGKFAIGQQSLPSLELEAPAAAPMREAEASARLESAALAGQIEQRRAEDAPRQDMIGRAMANIEARGGVASPYEAELLRAANMGQPFDRIDPSIGRPATTDEKLTAATGVPVGQEAGVGFGARETGSEAQRVAALEQRNAESMAEQEARNAANRAQAERETQAQIEQTSATPAAPPINDVIQALVVPGRERTAEQQLTIRQAEQRMDPADFSIAQRAATAPFQLNTEERMRLRQMRQGVTAPATAVAPSATPADTGLTGTRVLERLGQPTGGRIITTGAKLSTQRAVAPGATVAIKDGDTEHSVTVVDPSKLGAPGRLLTQVARIFGKRLVAFESDTLQADGFVMDGDNRSIFINSKTQISPLAVFGHELTHLLKRDNPQAYAALQAVVERELGEGALQQFEQEYGAGANVEELTSDLVGDRFQEPDFWTAVFDEVAAQNPEGARGIITRLAAAVTKAVNAFLKLVRQPGFQAERFVKDANAVKAAVTKALADYAVGQRETATQLDQEAAPTETVASTEPVDATLSPARRGGVAEEAGDFKIRTQKDGTLGVAGEVEQIRALLPEGIKGRAVPGGMVFTTSDAPRVRAALEGRKLAYSRGGQVIDKLPMKDGKYVGAPEKFNTPAKIPTLRKLLRQLTLEGERGRYWYENSSREVLQMVGGNVQEARKFVALLAIYSPQAKVDANSTFALRAWAQYKAGQEISVKTGVMDRKAQAAMDDVDAFWSGEKTGNFFFNLLREIDPSTAGKQGATIDMWMMRAGQYDSDAPTATQYAFMENETNRLAQELGWEPQQVQAAIWVAMKARMENAGVKKRTEASSEKKKWIRYDYPVKNGRPVKTRVILNAQAHRDNWLKHAFEHTPTKEDTAQAKFDFSDGLRRHIGQLSWEARPGRSTNVLPGVNDAPYEQQVEFQQAVQKALLDDNGVDLLAYKLGLLVDGPDILAPGVWQGEIAAGMQKLVALAPAKGDAGKTSIDPAQKQAIETYAAMMGLLLRQEGVGYHRPFYASTMSAANGVNLDVGRTLTPDEAKALWGAIDQRMRAAGVDNWENGAGMISSPTGMRVVNFGALDDNGKFRALVKEAAGTLPVDEVELVAFASDGDLVFNDWKESPNGEGYRSRIGAAGSPDLLDWARDVLAPRVQSVFNEFSSRYGWGDPGQVEALFDQAQSEEVTQPQPADQQAAPEGAQGAQLSRTRQAPDTPEFRRWFGDSKVVDADGQPLVVYHGSTGGGLSRTTVQNTFFSDNPAIASGYADPDEYRPGEEPVVNPVYLRIENPLVVDAEGEAWMRIPFEGQTVTTDDLAKAAKKRGHDGVIINNVDDSSTEEVTTPSTVYITLGKAAQFKSAVGNSGEFNPENADITRSRRRNIFGQPAPLANWTRPDDTKMDTVIYTMQDKLVDTKRVVEAIKAAVGSIDDKWNPYLQEELYHGRTAKQTQNFLNDELRPLMQEMQARGVDMATLEEYLHNRHAEERNIQIAKVNANMPDGGSGIDTADARAYLAALSTGDRSNLEALARQVDAITKGTRDLLVSSGLETQDTISKWEGAYSKYVPLNRDDVDFGSQFSGMGTGQGYQVKGSSSKRATGSSRDVVDILANIAMQRERAIVRAEKVNVAQAVYGLAVQNPNTDFWLAVDPAGQKDPAKAQADLVRMGINPIDAKNIIEEPVQTMVDPRTGLVVQRVNPLLRSSENVLAVRINGEEKYVFFNANDERAQRMVAALKNLDADQLGRVMSTMATVTRYFASINTQYNPIFGAVNFTRDVQGAMFNLTTTPIADRKAEVAANVMPALRGIYSDLRSRRKGNGPATGTWATLWEEFQREGGQTGFRNMLSRSAERAEDLQRMLAPDSWADSALGKVFTANGTLKVPMEFARKKAAPVFDWLSDYNETMENAVRLSAYKAALDKGISKQQAASIAKNLTVNFNRKGQVATQAGALYAFFNASVQGSTRLAETLKGPAGKKIIAGGLLLGTAQAMLLAAAGFDDDEPPEFVRERNLVIPTGDGKYVAIPMPLGLHVIPNTSRVLTEWALSGWKEPAKRIGQITGALLDAFNPIGNAGWSVQTIAPTVTDPLVALAENRDWTGKPIAKKDRSDTAPTPGYTRAKETASIFGKELAYYLNLATGGTKYKQGLISPTPDQIDYLIGQATGGVGREALKVQQTVSSSVTGEELPPYKVPLLGRFYGDTKSAAAESNKFYENITRINEHEAEIKGRMKNREGGIAEYRRENPEARLIEVANATEKEVQEMRKRRRELLEKGASKETIQIQEQRIAARMKRFNDRVKALRESAQQ